MLSYMAQPLITPVIIYIILPCIVFICRLYHYLKYRYTFLSFHVSLKYMKSKNDKFHWYNSILYTERLLHMEIIVPKRDNFANISETAFK